MKSFGTLSVKNKKVIFITVSTVILLIFLFFPVHIPYSIETMGKIRPYRELIVKMEPDGRFTSVLQNHMEGTVEQSSVTQYKRGDPISFHLHPNVIPGCHITAGDTLGWIESQEIERQLTQLTGELAVQNALLRQMEAGEKQAVIDEARKRLEYAREQVAEQQKIVKRTKDLFETKFVPQQDYEIAVSALRLYELNVEIAEKQLLSLQTGAKQEEINLVHSQIAAIETEIASLHERLERYTIISPLSGIALDSLSDDIILEIGDTTHFVIDIPLKLNIHDYIHIGQEVKFRFAGLKSTLYGNICKIGNVAQFKRDEQFFLAVAQINDDNTSLLPGTIARCLLVCAPVTPLEYFYKSISKTF